MAFREPVKINFKMNKLMLAGMFALLGMNFSTQAATYCVATNGLDGNPGTTNQPFATIQKATQLAMPGDTVLVFPGIYAERISTARSGSPDGNITFQALSGAIMDGFYVNHSYIVIDGFEITGYAYSGFQGSITLTDATNCYVINNYIHDTATNARGIQMTSKTSDCVFMRNRLNNTGNDAFSLHGYNNLISSNWVENPINDCIRCFGSGHVISQNTFTNVVARGGGHPDIIQTFGNIGEPANNILFERNLAINCVQCQICQLEQNQNPGIHDWVFRNNVYIRMGGAGNVGIPGVKWYNNLFYQCTTNTSNVLGFGWHDPDGNDPRGIATGAQVENNIFLECGINPSSTEKGWYNADPHLLDFQADHNYVGGPGFAPKKTFATNKAQLFTEPHGINGGNPQFESLSSLNFKPGTGSPLKNAGVSLSSLGLDILGLVRPASGAVDIGPYQVSGVKRPGPPTGLRIVTN